LLPCVSEIAASRDSLARKVSAFGIHFATTLVVALLAAALIFLVWYPAPFGRWSAA
jgi:hypothetical protein